MLDSVFKSFDKAWKKFDQAFESLNEAIDGARLDQTHDSLDEASLVTKDLVIRVKDKEVTIYGNVPKLTVHGVINDLQARVEKK